MSQVTLGGNPIEVSGTFPSAGQQAPDFTLVGADLGDVTLAKFAGKRKVLNIVPSLDTPTCATSTRKFNEAATKLDNTVVVVVSGDLPFAAKRFCTTEGIENVVTASTFRGREFAKAYGVDVTSGPHEVLPVAPDLGHEEPSQAHPEHRRDVLDQRLDAPTCAGLDVEAQEGFDRPSVHRAGGSKLRGIERDEQMNGEDR